MAGSYVSIFLAVNYRRRHFKNTDRHNIRTPNHPSHSKVPLPQTAQARSFDLLGYARDRRSAHNIQLRGNDSVQIFVTLLESAGRWQGFLNNNPVPMVPVVPQVPALSFVENHKRLARSRFKVRFGGDEGRAGPVQKFKVSKVQQSTVRTVPVVLVVPQVPAVNFL